MIRPGTRLGCPDCSTEVIVVRPSHCEVSLSCSGSGLVPIDAARPRAGHSSADGIGTVLGKRYVDDEVGIEILCTKPGPGLVACNGVSLLQRAAKPLPASD